MFDLKFKDVGINAERRNIRDLSDRVFLCEEIDPPELCDTICNVPDPVLCATDQDQDQYPDLNLLNSRVNMGIVDGRKKYKDVLRGLSNFRHRNTTRASDRRKHSVYRGNIDKPYRAFDTG